MEPHKLKVRLKTIKPQFTVQDNEVKKENLVANSGDLQNMQEPELFDNCTDKALYSSWTDNGKLVFQTRINTKSNTFREAQLRIPERQVPQAEQTSETAQPNESSTLQFNRFTNK